MDARAYFLTLYDHAHGHIPGFPRVILNEPTPEQMRTQPAGHNSIAWIVWHVARGEDWAVNTMLRGADQVLTRDNWNQSLGLSRLDFGPGMSREEVAQLSATVDLDALRAYFEGVKEETHRFIAGFDFDYLDSALDVEARLALAPAAIAPEGHVVRRIVEGQRTNRWFLNVMTLSDVYKHMEEAQHVFRLVAPDRTWA